MPDSDAEFARAFRTMTNRLTPERAVRLLRAKAGELEAQVLAEAETYGGVHRPVTMLAGDIALIATLLADHMESCNQARHYHTKTGKVLTDEDIEKLADEAEAGYDVTHLRVRNYDHDPHEHSADE